MKKQDITGIILAGGKSSRMGRDKALLLHSGRTFLQRIADVLSPLVDKIIVVSDNPTHNIINTLRVNDNVKDSGPLSGLITGLSHSKTQYNLVISCDVPKVTTDLLNQLLTASDETTELVQFKINNKTTPLVALYKTSCSSTLEAAFSQGERRLVKATQLLNSKTIPLENSYEALLSNVNTVADLKLIANDD